MKHYTVNCVNIATSPFHISIAIIGGLNMVWFQNPLTFCELNLANGMKPSPWVQWLNIKLELFSINLRHISGFALGLLVYKNHHLIKIGAAGCRLFFKILKWTRFAVFTTCIQVDLRWVFDIFLLNQTILSIYWVPKAGLNVSNTFSVHYLQIRNILKYACMSLFILKIILFVLGGLGF